MELVSLNETNTSFGIDKVKLHTKQFHVRELNLEKGWVGVPPRIQLNSKSDVWYVTGQGQELNEEKWYNNIGPAIVEVKQGGLGIHYNPSTIDHNFELTKDLSRSWEQVKHQLDDLGIQWEEDSCPMTRVDLTKQRVMQHPSYVYTNALGMVKGKRMNSRTYGSNAVEVRNTQRALVCYDKTLQLREQKNVTDAPNNLLRMEARWTSKKSIGALHQGLHLTNVGQLVTASTAHLEDCYNKFLTNNVFRTDGEQLSLDLVTERDVLTYYLNRHERGAFKQYVSSFGIPTMVEKFGQNLDLLHTLLLDVGYSRAQAYRNVDELRKSIQDFQGIQELRGGASPMTHLEHLQTTFTSSCLV
jgi:hypothetical protein